MKRSLVAGGAQAAAARRSRIAAWCLFLVPLVLAAAEPRSVPEYGARLLGSTQTVSLAALRGKVVLVNTWATWCPPCRKEMPDFEKAFQKHRAAGLQVVGVNIDEGSGDEEVQRFVKALGVSFPTWRDPENRFAKKFRVLGVPETFLLDRAGNIVRHWRGPMDPNAADGRQAIETALQRQPPA